MRFNGPHGRARLLGCVVTLSMTLPLMCCASTDSRSLNESAAVIGKLRAVRSLPPMPTDCAAEEPHVGITTDADPWTLLGEEGDHLNRQNQRTRRCVGKGGVYDQIKATQEKSTR